jgi:hypothetical protein
MAGRSSRRQRLLEPLLQKWGPEIARAFLASVDLVVNDADFARLQRRIAAGDISGALDALFLNAAAFAQFSAALASSFNAGGSAATQSMPKRRPDGTRLVVRFDGSNPQAEQWLRDYSSQKVAEILEDQRNMVRDRLSRGMARGDNPRTVALDLVGRIDKATGKREGGLIGLTQRQEASIAKAADELSGVDREMLENYLSRKLRNKSFDRHVVKALRDGTPIPADIRRKMVTALRNATLKFRGDMIGRTEALSVLHRGRYQAFAQAITSGEVSADEVTRSWQSASDNRVRESHAKMNGQTIGFYEYYTTPSGAKLLFPGDPAGPASEIINCRCTENIRINFLSRLRR